MKIHFKTDLRTWLEDNRWTPKSLADVLGVSRQTIHHWMDGASLPKNEDLIFTLLTLSSESLIGFDDARSLPTRFNTILKQQQMSQFFEVEGGHALEGEVVIPGAKNAALPMLCAALLTKEECIFHNVPEITDIDLLLEIFETLGVTVQRDLASKVVSIKAEQVDPNKLKTCAEAKKFRASILILGPLLARCGHAEIMRPGGCVIGARPNDIHFNGFETLGTHIEETPDSYRLKFTRKNFKEHQILLPEASVTATENLAMFAAGVPDESEIFFTAAETHVTATLEMLQQMGADISGIRTHRLQIKGKKCDELKGGEFTIPPDGLLAGTYALAGVLTEGKLTIKNVYHTELLSFYGALRRTGASFSFAGDTLKIFGSQQLRSVPKIQTAIYPGFSTDLQSPFGVLLTQCEGESMIFETLFENRLTYLNELEKMGARVQMMNAHQAKIIGKTRLRGVPVQSWDLRAGAAMVLAGLIADGTTKVTNINYIDRGYEHFDKNLQVLGAQIVRKN